tara:strand:- start:80 stop:979 length:900 start_codon:yes stop_codon:yes gene_type:complete
MRTYVFDIDGTICTNTNGEYKNAEPFLNNIQKINYLYSKGNYIKYFTARGSGTGIDWYEITKKQLDSWGAKYHELILGKPEGDIYVDDKGINALLWDWWDDEIEISDNKFDQLIIKELLKNVDCIKNLIEDKKTQKLIGKVVKAIQKCIDQDGKIMFAGNGGSFSDAQHLSAEFTSKLFTDRKPLPSITLGTNSSTSTAIGNDYGFENIFSREIEGIGNSNDLLLAFSTSGNSKNIINAINKCKDKSINYFLFTGNKGGKCSEMFSNIIKMPSNNTAIIQQLHITVGHIICKLSENKYL